MKTANLLQTIIFIFTITCSLTTPVPDNAHSIHEHYNNEQQSTALQPKEHLFLYIFEGFQNLTSLYIHKAANISENILKDSTLNTKDANDNVVVQQFKKNLTDFLQKYQASKEFENALILVELYSNFTSDYYEIPQEQLTADTKMIVDILRKYGSEDLDKELHKMYDHFVIEFCKEFESVKGFLERKMLDWFEQFKLLTDINERSEAFGKFVMLYEE